MFDHVADIFRPIFFANFIDKEEKQSGAFFDVIKTFLGHVRLHHKINRIIRKRIKCIDTFKRNVIYFSRFLGHTSEFIIKHLMSLPLYLLPISPLSLYRVSMFSINLYVHIVIVNRYLVTLSSHRVH